MYGNLVSTVSHILTADVIADMASVAGISNPALARKVAAGAVPAILAAMAQLAARPEGAQMLFEAIGKQPPLAIDALMRSVPSERLADREQSTLTNLIGSDAFFSLARATGNFAGVGDGAVRRMIGMLTSVALGVLGREVDLGATGVAHLLASQKDHLAAAIPGALADALHSSGVLGLPVSAASTINAHRGRAAGAVMAWVGSPVPSPAPVHWAYWALPLAAIAGLLGYLFGGDAALPPVAVAPTSAPSASPAQSLYAQNEVGRRMAAVIDALDASLQRAQGGTLADALPQLQQGSSELDRLSGTGDRLTTEGRERLTEAVSAVRARLKSTLVTVDALPGTPGDVKMTMAALDAKLDRLLAPVRGAPENGHVTFIAAPPGDGVPIRGYLDQAVYNGTGERIGIINDLVIGTGGKIDAVVVGVDAFLGIGEKNVAVIFRAIRRARHGGATQLVADATRDELRDAPSYGGTSTNK